MARYGRSDGPVVVHAGDGTAAIVDCWIEDEHGERVDELPQGRPARMRMEVELRTEAETPASASWSPTRRAGRAGPRLGEPGPPTGTFDAGRR